MLDSKCGLGDVICCVFVCAIGDVDFDVVFFVVFGCELLGEVVEVGVGVDLVVDGDAIVIHVLVLELGGFVEYVCIFVGVQLLLFEGVDPIAVTLLGLLAVVLRV